MSMSAIFGSEEQQCTLPRRDARVSQRVDPKSLPVDMLCPRMRGGVDNRASTARMSHPMPDYYRTSIR